MTIEMLCDVLKWCSIINIGLLLWWFLFLTFAHDFVFRMHGRWFKLSVERFDAIHYSGIMFFKMIVFVFFIVPYLALSIVF